MIVRSIGEQIHLVGGTTEPLDWRRAQGLALTLQGHADAARRRQYEREERCLSCGAFEHENHKPGCAGPDNPASDPTAARVREEQHG